MNLRRVAKSFRYLRGHKHGKWALYAVLAGVGMAFGVGTSVLLLVVAAERRELLAACWDGAVPR